MDDTQKYKTLFRRGLLIAAIIFIADQLTKYFIRGLVRGNGGHIEVLPFFNLVEVWNYGVSFGMFQAGNPVGVYILIAITSMITALFSVLLWHAKRRFEMISYALVIGGALGNIVDRIYFGAVYDFLDFHAFGYHWPAFNIADSCILIGIALVALDSLFLSPKTKTTEKNDAS